MNAKTKHNNSVGTIALTKKARHDYFLEEKHEAGIALLGWEVKAIRDSMVQLVDSYVEFHRGEAWLHGALITPLQQASTHLVCEHRRQRKLLLHRREIYRLAQKIQAKGYTCVCTAMYWKGPNVMRVTALAKGKQSHDKRDTLKDRDWAKQKERVMKHSVR